jgi:hypothetical protein
VIDPKYTTASQTCGARYSDLQRQRTADILAARGVRRQRCFRHLISATSALAGETSPATLRSACMRLAGDLDYESIDELVDNASQLLAQQATWRTCTWISAN